MSAKATKAKTLYLVIQEGGSSGEHYPSLYDRQRDAQAAARSHRKASYRSTAPITVVTELHDGKAFVSEEELLDLIERLGRIDYE